MSRGTITKIVTDRVFGYIDTGDGKDLYFHYNEVLPNLDDFFNLRVGDRVEFEIGNDDRHKPRATQVHLIV